MTDQDKWPEHRKHLQEENAALSAEVAAVSSWIERRTKQLMGTPGGYSGHQAAELEILIADMNAAKGDYKESKSDYIHLRAFLKGLKDNPTLPGNMANVIQSVLDKH